MDTLKCNIVAGSISGLCEVLLTHPLDLFKTQAQYHNIRNPVFNTAYFAAYSRFNDLYVGIRPRILGVVPMRTVFWTTLETTKYILPQDLDPTRKYVIAGLFAGITQSFVDTPIENLKVKQITNDISDYRKVRLFNGFGVTMLRNMGFAVVLNVCIHTHNDHSDKRVDFIRAGLGAVLGSILTQPLDYIKTQIQAEQYPSAPHIIHNVSLKTLFTGYITRATMGFINIGIGYTVFSQMCNLLKQ